MSVPQIRFAAERDLPELVRIYNNYVTTTHATFDINPFTVDQRRPWFDSFSESGPHQLFIAEVADRPVGYASSQRFSANGILP